MHSCSADTAAGYTSIQMDPTDYDPPLYANPYWNLGLVTAV